MSAACGTVRKIMGEAVIRKCWDGCPGWEGSSVTEIEEGAGEAAAG